MNWLPIDSAPKDGTAVLLAVQVYMDATMEKAAKEQGIGPVIHTYYGKWSTWDQCWRQVGDGFKIGFFPSYYPVHAWAAVDDPPLRPQK